MPASAAMDCSIWASWAWSAELITISSSVGCALPLALLSSLACATARGVTGRAGDDPELDAVDMDAARVPVERIAHQRDVILDHAVRHLEGAGARGRLVETPGVLQRLGRGHQPRAVRELRDQRREWVLEIEPHGQRIDHVDRVERRHLRLAPALGQMHGAVEVERYSGRVEVGAVRELDAGPELEGDGLAILRGRPRE